MKELFVCEKPSVARDMAAAISGGCDSKDGYYIGKDGKVYTYAFGHLVKTVDPEEINPEWGWNGKTSSLPFFTKDIPLTVDSDEGRSKQYKIIVELMKEAELIYISTDAGREGEHIFRNIYSLSGVNKPLKRLWIQDFTKAGIIKEYHNAKNAELYKGLALAGKLRNESDLLIGINATMLLTKLSGSKKVLSLGRVQTPTLALIVKRDRAIKNFEKVVHYSILAEDTKGNKFEINQEPDTLWSKNDAEIIFNELGKRQNFAKETKEKAEKPEMLFDLTSLQIFMNRKHKWSAAKTLKFTEALYLKQYVTYPRTNSNHLASDSELSEVLAQHVNSDWVTKLIENNYQIEPSFVDPNKVSDHEAIIITTKPGTGLEGDEELLYKIIFDRFIAAFYPKSIKRETTATFIDGAFQFKCKESVLSYLGWREIFNSSIEESSLIQTNLDDIGKYEIVEKVSQAPKFYTEGTLLGDMKNAGKFLEDKDDKKLLKHVEGIGTTATRDTIIETLIKRNFIERNNNNIISTKLGQEIIEMMPDEFSLYSVELTAFFETQLGLIQKGELEEVEYYDELKGLIDKICIEIRENVKTVKTVSSDREVIALCPNCGKEVYENNKAYSCSGYKDGCGTSLWKNGLEKLGKKNITKAEAKKLLSGKKINVKLKGKYGDYKKEVVFNQEKSWLQFADK